MLQQSRPANKAYKLVPTTNEKQVWRICRLRDSDNSSDGQNTEPRNDSVQQDNNTPGEGENSGHREVSGPLSPRLKPVSNAYSFRDKTSIDSKQLEAELPRFGPSYGEDDEATTAAKEEAWSHILNKTPEEEQSSISVVYLSAIKKIEKKAKENYDPEIISRLKKSEFRRIMVRDGCFFLQLALYILGASELLGYPENDVYFGREMKEGKISRWIKAMFFIGNQIPCIVIRQLMKQTFFQNVIKKGIETGTWLLPYDLPLPKMVLYLIVVAPELESNSQNSSSSSLFSKLRGQNNIESSYFKEPPCDILHAFHCLVLGPGNDLLEFEADDAIDLEAGAEDFDRNNRFPSATELKQSGISLRRSKQLGSREIRFSKHFWVFAHLYVPPLTFDGDTELILRYLRNYEVEQQPGKNKREVTAFLRFMRDLIQTPKDVSILESKGIIQVKRMDHKDRLPGILSRLVSSEDVAFTQHLRLTRLQILEHSRPPWHLLSLALFLTVIQTVFTILSYVEPRT